MADDLTPDPLRSHAATATIEADKATAAAREQAAEEVKAAQKQFEEALDAIEKLDDQRQYELPLGDNLLEYPKIY